MKERKTFYINKVLSEKLRAASFYENRPQSVIVEIALARYMKGVPATKKENEDDSKRAN